MGTITLRANANALFNGNVTAITVSGGQANLQIPTAHTVAHIANVSGSNTRLLIDSYGGQPNITPVQATARLPLLLPLARTNHLA